MKRHWAYVIIVAAILFLAVAHSFAKEDSTPHDPEFIEKLKAVPVTIHCRDAEIGLLLRGIAKQAGINIYVPEDVKGKITLDFEDVTLYDLFATIVSSQGLRYEERNGIVFISRGAAGMMSYKNLTARRIEIIIGDAQDYVDILTPLLSPMGRIRTTTISQNTNDVDTDSETNLNNIKKYLIVMDTPDRVLKILDLVKRINHAIRQIYIQARIVMINKEAKEELGIAWSFEERGGKLSNVIDDLRKSGDNQALWDLVKNSGAFNLNASSTLTLGIVKDALKIDAEIKALQDRNLAKVLSAPRVMVLDGESAIIKQGQEVPYVTTNRFGESNVEFKEAILSLNVVPTILPNDYIVLQVSITNDSVSHQVLANNYPLLNKQAMSTSLFLRDGVTVVIGGIQVKNDSNGELRVPILSNIPLIGRVFRHTVKQNDNMELLVFLTPRVVQMSPEDFLAWGGKEDEETKKAAR